MHSEDEGIYDCPFDIDTQLATKNGPLETVEFMLQPNDWIDGASEYIELQAAFFNAEVRLYSFAKLRFTFEKGGFMHKTVKVNALSENLYPSFWYIVPDLIFLGMVSTLAYQEGGEVIHCRNTGLLKYYLSDFWNLIDWVSILAGFGISFLWFQMVIATGLLGDQLAEMVPAPAVITQSYRAKWGKILDELDTLGTTQEVQFMLLYWYTLVLMLRFFKNFQGQPRLSQISSTLMKSLGDMVHFIIVFAVVLINFAIGGNLMFGTSSENWATIMDSVNTSMMALLGNIDMDQLMQISPITAYLWFWSFMVVNFFVLLNLLVAIVFDHYYNFRDTVGETQGLGSQIWDVMGEKSWSMDWYLQRKQYLKKGIIPKPDYLVFEFTIRGRTFGIDPARFGYLWLDEQMGYEDVYEALMEESPEGPQYGRPTLLEQMQKKRNADRQAFEESLRKDGKIFSRSPAKEAEGVAGSCPGTEGAHASPFDLEMSDTDFESHADGRGTTTYGGSKGSSYVPPRERVGQNMAKHETDRRKIIGAGRRRTNSKPMRGLFAIREEGTLRSTSKNKNIEKLRSAMTANNMHMLRNSMNIANEQMNRGVGGYDSEQITGIHPNHGVFGEGHHRMADDDDEDSKPILVGDGESSGGKESSAAGRDAAEKKEEGSESPGGGLDHSGSGAGTSEGEGSNKDDAADASGDPDVRKKKTMSAFQRHEEQLAYLREQIGVAELEELGVEPRFARHLMLRCKKFVLDETGYEEKRKQELTSLARNAADLLNDIQHETVALVKQVNLVLEGVCKSCADLSMDVDGTHMKLANLQRQRGVMACRGTAVAALPYSEQLWNQGKMTKTVPGLQEEEDNRRNAALELLGGVGAKKAFKALLPVAAASSAKG
ncbi:unnamed protein product [Amoebophrya sp. A25]|nr:unnamed protein product [Amoebophrya sp. A25]|eukprot:GSA25T00002324001.1